MANDMFKQPIHIGDYVCCTSSSTSTGMYIAKVDAVTAHKVQAIDRRGNRHQKSFNKVFVCTEQINSVPELMI